MNKLVKIEDEDGKEILFKDFIVDMSGTGFIYGSECSEIIDKAVSGELDWVAIDDYFGPLVHEIINEAASEDTDLFLALAHVAKLAYSNLKQKYAENLEVRANE